jgi:hypothetical protein
MADVKMVFDTERKALITYMNNEGEKMAMAMKMPEIMNNVEDSVLNDSFSFEKTGNTKEILGYTCNEFIGESPDYRFTTYVTQETDVTFGNFYKMDRKNLPSGFDPEWLEDGPGLMMEMEIIEKSKKKNNVSTITCTKLEPFSFSLSNDEYNFMQYGNQAVSE